ncbi:MAG: peptidylprolyl isomerase [Anaerolineales bacterium]|nr:peptidylprolyl isomerase [Anaerolineales bacterium]
MPPHNKKFLAQKEKEDRQKRIIIIATISVLVIVFALVAYGVIDRFVLTPKVTLIELEDQTISADQFEQQVKWRRRNLIMDVDQMLMTFQQLGGTQEVFGYFEQQLMVAVNSLQQPLLVGQDVLQALTEDIILLVEAEKMGVIVDDVRIDNEIQEAFGYFVGGTATPAATLAPSSTPATSDNQDGEPDPTATPLLQPTEYTEELFNNNYQEFLLSVKDAGISEETIRDIIKISVIREEIIEIVSADIAQEAEHVWIRHILVADEDTANEVIEKLADGEDFADLAAEYSLDTSNKDNGGDLDWFSRGAMVQPFEEAAFALEVGEISDPVQTDFGWHIMESLGKDDLLLDPSAYQQLRNQAYVDWMSEKKTIYQPIINEDWSNYVPSEPALPPDYLAYIQSISLEQPQLPPDVPTDE